MSQNPEVAAVLQGCKHLYSSSPPSYLNDSQAEYVVQTIKHFFDKFIIVQYSILNTLEDHILSDVRLKVSNVDSLYQLKLHSVVHLDKADSIKFNEKKYVYAVLTKEDCEHPFPQGKVTQKLAIKITEIEVDSKDELGSYEEDYSLEPMHILVKDYLTATQLAGGQFKGVWDTIGADPKLSETSNNFQITFKTMESAVQGVIKFLGMAVCDQTDRINVTEKVHNLLMAGTFLGREMVLVRAQIGFN